MSLVPSFLDLLQPLSCVMTTPTFGTFLTVITGWVFARRAKHHSAYHRLFAAAR